MNDETLNKISKKSGVDKDTIVSLARKLSNGNMKDESTIRSVINTLKKATGKNISEDLEDKIVKTIKEDKVPENLDKMF